MFKKRCATCHKIGTLGHAVGPDLAALSDKRPGSLLVAILDPNRAVESKFLSYTAITTAGLSHQGMLVEETGTSITLLAGDGKQIVLPRVELEAFVTANMSLMPEGMEKDLTPQDIADCLAFLGELRAQRKPFAGNEPAVVRPEALRGELYALAGQAEVYGKTLVYEPAHRNLGYWQSADDHAAWTLEVPAEQTFELSIEYACPASAAGNRFQVLCGTERIEGTTASTGSWEVFTAQTLQRVVLPAGQSRLIVRAEGAPRGALFDLQSVRLRPVR